MKFFKRINLHINRLLNIPLFDLGVVTVNAKKGEVAEEKIKDALHLHQCLAKQDLFPHWKENLKRLLNGQTVRSLYFTNDKKEIAIVTDPQTNTTEVTIKRF